jgi:hypothetical protein
MHGAPLRRCWTAAPAWLPSAERRGLASHPSRVFDAPPELVAKVTRSRGPAPREHMETDSNRNCTGGMTREQASKQISRNNIGSKDEAGFHNTV